MRLVCLDLTPVTACFCESQLAFIFCHGGKEVVSITNPVLNFYNFMHHN